MKSHVLLVLVSTNMETKSQLLSPKKPLKYNLDSLKLDLGYFM